MVALHVLAVNVPMLRPTTPEIEVWETADGAWWLGDMAKELSIPEYNIANSAAEHKTMDLANNESTESLG